MKLDERKIRQAHDRAYCVSEYRAWLDKKPRSISFQSLIERLKSRCMHVGTISRRSLLRWHRLAGQPTNIVMLIDRRSGRSAKTYAWWASYRSKPGGAHQKALEAIGLTKSRKIADALIRLSAVWAWTSFEADCPDLSPAAFGVFLFCLRCEFPDFNFSRRSLFRWRESFAKSGVDSLIDRRGGRREPFCPNADHIAPTD